MSLDITLTANRPSTVFEYNITHNLWVMADAAGLYQYLWRPEDVGITTARELIAPLTQGMIRLKKEKESLEKLNPSNGWGKYEDLYNFVKEYLDACKKNPDAEVSVDR